MNFAKKKIIKNFPELLQQIYLKGKINVVAGI